MMVKAKKKRRSVLEGFLNKNFDDKALREASDLASEITQKTDHTDQPLDITDHPAKGQSPGRTVAVSGQNKDTKRAGHGQDNHTIIALSGRHDSTMIALSGQGTGRTKKGQDTGRTRAGSKPQIRLPRQQEIIYNWLSENSDEGIYTVPLIEKETGVPYGTIRKALSKLINSGLIRVEYDRSVKKFEYQINSEVRVRTDKTGSKRAVSGQDRDSKRAVSGQALIEEEDIFIKDLLLLAKSDVFPSLDKIGFEKTQLSEIAKIWKIRGIPLDDLPVSLEYANWDVENNPKIGDPLAYVYSALKQGPYRKPPKFRTQAELETEAIQIRISEKKEQARKLKELYSEEWKQDRNIRFSEMMSKPDGELYQRCVCKLNATERRRERKGGPIFEKAMRRVFDEISDSDEEEA